MSTMPRIHTTLTILALLAGPLVACDPPEADDPFAESVPTPSGVIHGTVFYSGPRPICVRDTGGRPVSVSGNVILLIFLSDDPPPPSGTATSAENLFVIPASEMFDLSDCMPPDPTAPELALTVTRSVGFDWSDIALIDERTLPTSGEGCSMTAPSGACDAGLMCESVPARATFGTCVEPRVDYQIRGFLDRDADFNPFFGVRRLTTRADVAGGAFVDISEDPPQFRRITFGSIQGHLDGQEIDGVTITLAALVNTELPAFELIGSTHATSSEDIVPRTSDAVERERLIYEQTEMQLGLIDPREASWATTLAAAGMVIDPDPSGYGFFIHPVDADRDGVQDLHPILGAGGVLWQHPIVIMRRARTLVELAVGVPDALMIATVRPTQTIAKETFAPNIDIGVAPIAVVTMGGCQIPYIAPGNLAEIYERIPVACQELPTGNYDINVLTGIAGGTAVDYRAQLRRDMPALPDIVLDIVVSSRTDTDWVIEGGTFSSQAWSIPNELGCPDPVYRPNALDADGRPIAVSQVDADPFADCGDPLTAACDSGDTNMQCSQGPAGRFSIVDPDGSNAPDHRGFMEDGYGVPGCVTAVRAATMMPDRVSYMDIPASCCAPVAHLCGLPLCPLRPAAILPDIDGGNMIREMVTLGEDYVRNDDGSITPLCVPFLPPEACCR